MLRVYDQYKYFTLSVRGSTLDCQIDAVLTRVKQHNSRFYFVLLADQISYLEQIVFKH